MIKTRKQSYFYIDSTMIDNMPLISIKINGKSNLFILNTGSSINIIFHDLWKGIRNSIRFLDFIENPFDSENYTALVQISFEFKREKYTDVFFTLSRKYIFFNRYPDYVKGCIGTVFLNRIKYVIDFGNIDTNNEVIEEEEIVQRTTNNIWKDDLPF